MAKHEQGQQLEWRREAVPKRIEDYGDDEDIPAYIEHTPGPGAWFLDGEPISEADAQQLLAAQVTHRHTP